MPRQLEDRPRRVPRLARLACARSFRAAWRRGRPWVLAALLGLAGGGSAALGAAFDMAPRQQSDSGHIRLVWGGAAPEANGITYELQQASQPDFSDARVRYTGPDHASFLSGLPDGLYFYRVRSRPDGHWSEPVTLTVKHPSRALAFALCGVGAIVFVLTAGVVIRGSLEVKPTHGV